MPEQILQGLIQKARIDATAHDYRLRKRRKPTSLFTVDRWTPKGWVWNADFGERSDAEDYLVCKLTQEQV